MFGTRDCLYLVSVSEEALGQLDRRAVGARTALDSTFDELVRVGPANLAVTVELPQRRVIGVPYPFLLFCHCLGGGLPRDVIRTARAVVAAARAESDNRLPTVAEQVALADGHRGTRGLLGRIAALPPGRDVDGLLAVLDDPAWPGRNGAEIGAALDRVPYGGDPELAAVVDQLAGTWFFTAALLEVFVARWREVAELFEERTADGFGATDPDELDPADPDWYRSLPPGWPELAPEAPSRRSRLQVLSVRGAAVRGDGGRRLHRRGTGLAAARGHWAAGTGLGALGRAA